MRKSTGLLFVLCLLTSLLWGQVSQEEVARLRQQMAKIRQSTNWNDPAAAKKANEEIQKLARQMTGQNNPFFQGGSQSSNQGTKQNSPEIKITVSKENVLALADRYYKRSYKSLDAVSKAKFDQDYKMAEYEKFNLKAVRRLTSMGALLISFGNDPDIACVYLASAMKAVPADTLSVNNFGGYLRLIDSVGASLPILLYANKLFSGSPVIHTQLGNSYLELGDLAKAEAQYKEALKLNPDFAQAHTALCDLYIKQKRWQDAILELFAGVKGMGATYNQASQNYAAIQQGYGGGDDSDTKSDFWDETQKQLDPSDAIAPLVPEDNRVKMPRFPSCPKVEDWLEGGGYTGAAQAFQAFHAYSMSFAEEFGQVHKQLPALSPNMRLRDYPNERFALDCITEMFFHRAYNDAKEYNKTVDNLLQQVGDAKERYLKNLAEYTKEYTECLGGCGGDDYCMKECHRKFCAKECPNANQFNQFLSRSYLSWSQGFDQLVIRQKQFLDDLYGFSAPWFNKISSPYWSRIYAYEIKRVALTIVGNCYGAFPVFYQTLAHNDCGTDCSMYANPYPQKPDEVNKNKPEGNECQEGSKKELSLLACNIGWDCESWEFGCTEILAGSIKRNTVKKTTTMFVGVGLEAGLGVAKAEGKFGGQITIGDDGSVDGGLRASASGSSVVPATKGGPKGKEVEFNISVMGGVKAETTNIMSPFSK